MGIDNPNSSQTRREHIEVTDPRHQSSKDAPGLPVALSNNAGVTKIPDPNGYCVSWIYGAGLEAYTNSSIHHGANDCPET